MNKLLKEPLLHFLAIGVALFAFNAWRESVRPGDETTAPHIDVTADVIERLRAGYERQFGRTPNEEELREQVTAHIREEVLCREALALGLDRNDTIVRRRLAQKMEFLTADIGNTAEPAEIDLQKFFAEHAARYANPGRVSFRHVFFSPAKRGVEVNPAAAEVLTALTKGASDDTYGDPFLHGYAFAERDVAEVAAAFGAEFARQLAAVAPGAWHGPVTSTYGLHLVRVEARQEPQAAKFDEVRETVLRDFREDRRLATNRDFFERLRERYEVTIDEAALAQATAIQTAQR